MKYGRKIKKAPTKKRKVTTIVCVFLRKTPTKNVDFIRVRNIYSITETFKTQRENVDQNPLYSSDFTRNNIRLISNLNMGKRQ